MSFEYNAMARLRGCPDCLAAFRTGIARCPLDGAELQEVDGDYLAGSTLAGRYVIEECVGEGSTGRVYRARHQQMSRLFAVKILYGDHLVDREMRARFAREAEAASLLNHTHVVPVTDFGETEHGVPFLVMDWVEGRNLAVVAAREAPMNGGRCERLLRQLLRGLAHAHQRGLVHRDFKPENVIVTRERGGRDLARIGDFGTAIFADAASRARITGEDTVIGTPAYMAPEHATGGEVDARSDLFSLGVMLYELLAGVLPFSGAGAELARKNLRAEPPAIAERVPGLGVDPALEAIALRLMAKRPADRFQSAREVLEELDRARDGATATPDRDPDAGADDPEYNEPEKGTGRLRTIVIPCAAVTIAVISVLVASSRGPRSAEPGGPFSAVVERDRKDLAERAAAPSAPGDDAEIEHGLAADASDRESRQPLATHASRGRRPAPPAALDHLLAPDDLAALTDVEEVERAGGRDEPSPAPESFAHRYRRVGEAIEELARAHGDEAAAPLRDRFFRIPLNDAIKNLAIRRESHRALLDLETAIRNASR